jgi:hypothetical protein
MHQLVRLGEPAPRLGLALLEEDRPLFEPHRAQQPAPGRPDPLRQRGHRLDGADAGDRAQRVERRRQDAEHPGRLERVLGDPLEPAVRERGRLSHRDAPSAPP